jgi:hypothetical protein
VLLHHLLKRHAAVCTCQQSDATTLTASCCSSRAVEGGHTSRRAVGPVQLQGPWQPAAGPAVRVLFLLGHYAILAPAPQQLATHSIKLQISPANGVAVLKATPSAGC